MKTSLWIKITLVTGTLLLAACGQAPGPQENTRLRLAYPSGMNGIYPVVLERGEIAPKHGIDGEYLAFQNGPPMMEALAAGEVDAIITSLLPVTSYLSRQPEALTLVAQLGYSSHALLVPGDSDASTLADLKGRQIAVSFRTESHVDLIAWIRESGFDDADFTLVNTPPNELPVALGQKLVDAAVIRQPQSSRVQETFGARELKTWPFYFVAVISTPYLEKHPEVLPRFIAALKEAVYFTNTHPDQAAEWFGEKLRIDPKFVAANPNEDPAFVNLGSIDDVQVAITGDVAALNARRLQLYVDTGALKEPVTLPHAAP